MPVTQVLAVIPVSDFDAGRSWWERLLGAPGEQPMPGEDVLEWHVTDTGGVQLVRDAARSGVLPQARPVGVVSDPLSAALLGQASPQGRRLAER